MKGLGQWSDVNSVAPMIETGLETASKANQTAKGITEAPPSPPLIVRIIFKAF